MKITGFKTFKYKKYRFQLYYLNFNISKRDIYFNFDNRIRITIQDDYHGFGFQICGFGFGGDWAKD